MEVFIDVRGVNNNNNNIRDQFELSPTGIKCTLLYYFYIITEVIIME